MASEILLASFNYYYDYEGETSTNELQYLPDTVEFRLYEYICDYYEPGEVAVLENRTISHEDALKILNNELQLFNDYDSVSEVEVSDSKEALEIIDNLRHEVESECSNAERKENTMSEQAQNQNTQEKAKYANVKIPAAFLTQHEYTAKSGRTFEKAYVHFPEGTKVNGVDLSHYSCDVFVNDRMKQQMLSGGQVTIGFKADEPVQVWTGHAGDEQNPYKKFEVKPWDLVKGIKAANESFKSEKAAKREAAKEQGATLKGESEQMRESSAKLAGDNTPEEHANTR